MTTNYDKIDEILSLLKDLPDDFPNPRVLWFRWDSETETYKRAEADPDRHNALIEWGDPMPQTPPNGSSKLACARYHLEVGRLFGYREDVIRDFLIRIHGAEAATQAF